MEGEDSRSQGGGAGLSSGEGPFFELKHTFQDILNKYGPRSEDVSLFTEGHIREWAELSSSLTPANSVKHRAKALAFILQRCETLLTVRQKGPGCIASQEEILKNARYVLWHACMDDHSGYTLLQRRCFGYYGECVTALDIFYQETVSLMGAGLDAEANWKELRRLMHESGSCVLRCWSMIRCQDSDVPHVPPTLRGDYWSLVEPEMREKYQFQASPGVDPDMERFAEAMIEVHGMLTLHICLLALDLLTGMKKNLKLEVNREEPQILLNESKDLMEGPGGGTPLVDKLREGLYVVRGRYETANLGADNLQKLNAFLKAGTEILPPEMSSIAAAAWLGHECDKFFDEKLLIDLRTSSQLDHSHFRDATDCLIFSAAPGIYAIRWLVYWRKFLGPDAEASAMAKTAAFYKKLHSRLQEKSGPARPTSEAAKELPAPLSKSAKKRAKQKAKKEQEKASQSQGAGP